MTKKSSWDNILQDVGLASPKVPEVADAPAPPEPVAQPIAQPVAQPPRTAQRRPASFGAGLIDEPAQPVRPEPVREEFAPSRREDLRATHVAEAPDLVAEITATEAKSSSFFDMLPSFNIFGKKKLEPAMPEPVNTPRDDEPLPTNLFGAKPPVTAKPAPRTSQAPRATPPREAREVNESRERGRDQDRGRTDSRERARTPETSQEPRERNDRGERGRANRPERSLTPERAAAFADPWTDVATQLGAVAEKRRSEQHRSERAETTRPSRNAERAERVDRVERTAEPREERSRERRKPRHEGRREERPKPQHAEERPPVLDSRRSETRSEVRSDVPTWSDAVSTVVGHNQSRRRR